MSSEDILKDKGIVEPTVTTGIGPAPPEEKLIVMTGDKEKKPSATAGSTNIVNVTPPPRPAIVNRTITHYVIQSKRQE
jgi:hypothetical protein